MSRGPSPWTPAADERVIALNAKGHSAKDISEVLRTEFGLTVSRNAVGGKIDRLRKAGRIIRENRISGPSGATRRRAKSSAMITGRPSGHPPMAAPAPPLPPRPQTEAVNAKAANFGRGVSLLNIGAGQCRFPLNNPEDKGGLRFCGNPAAKSAMLQRQSYCHAHADIATLNRRERVPSRRGGQFRPRLNF